MSRLRLGKERVYTPEEFGLETPLVFASPNLAATYSGLEMRVTDLRYTLGTQIREQQVDHSVYDRAVIPAWLIEGNLPDQDGFFKGVLRPARYELMAGRIGYRQMAEFQFYIERLGSFEHGISVHDNDIRQEQRVRALVVAGQRLDRAAVGHEFFERFGILDDPSLVVFQARGYQPRRDLLAA